jgi:hypothetical protein
LLALGVDNSSNGWQCYLRTDTQIVWQDKNSYPTSHQARLAAEEYIASIFRALFSMEPSDINPWKEVLERIDPQWLEEQALERETFGGKSFTENVLDIIKERCYAA